MMLTSVFFLLLLSSGSIYCAARYGKAFERTLPVTAIGFVAVLLVFGILGFLKAGVWAVIAIALVLYGFAAWQLVRQKNWRSTLSQVLTPGLVVFFGGVLVYSFLYRGKLPSHWDEFTHWMDVAKVFSLTGDFGTNPAAYCGHGSYPPGMTLIEFLCQELYGILSPGTPFTESLAYIAYQSMMLSILVPLMAKCSFRKPLSIVAYGMALVLSPLLFFEDYFANILVDPALGVLSGAGMTAIFLTEEDDKDWLFDLYILSLCTMLVLTKDAGLLFAVMLAAAFLFDRIPGIRSLLQKKYLLLFVAAVAAVLVPKLLWDFEVNTSGISVRFGTDFDVSQILLTFAGGGEPYRMEVLTLFVKVLHDWTYPLGNTTIQISYISLTMVLLFFVCLVLIRCQGSLNRGRNAAAFLLGLQLLVYIGGLCFAYMFKFQQAEAESLMSFPRYMCIGFLPVWLFLVFASLHLALNGSVAQRLSIVAWCLAFLAIVPTRPVVSFVSRSDVSASVTLHSDYMHMDSEISEYCEAGDQVYLVSQDRSNLDARILKYRVRPVHIRNSSCALAGPDDEAGRLQQLQQWQADIKGYDYVALLYLNDYFYETFSPAFENPDEIQENAVYRVDQQTGMLTLCKGV